MPLHIQPINTETGCEDGDIRLADGDDTGGRVEMCFGGVWGVVCDDFWDFNDARVVCRNLGMPSNC